MPDPDEGYRCPYCDRRTCTHREDAHGNRLFGTTWVHECSVCSRREAAALLAGTAE